MNKVMTKIGIGTVALGLATMTTAFAGAGVSVAATAAASPTTSTTLGPPAQGTGVHNVFLYVDTVTGAGSSPAPAAGCAQTNLFQPGQVVVFRMDGVNVAAGGIDLTSATVLNAYVKVPGLTRIPMVYGTHGKASYWTAAWTIVGNLPRWDRGLLGPRHHQGHPEDGDFARRPRGRRQLHPGGPGAALAAHRRQSLGGNNPSRQGGYRRSVDRREATLSISGRLQRRARTSQPTRPTSRPGSSGQLLPDTQKGQSYDQADKTKKARRRAGRSHDRGAVPGLRSRQLGPKLDHDDHDGSHRRPHRPPPAR